MLPVMLFSVSLFIYWHVTSYVFQSMAINLLACYQLFYSVYHYLFIGMLPVMLFSVSLFIYWHVTSCVIQSMAINLLACYQLFYSVYHY